MIYSKIWVNIGARFDDIISKRILYTPDFGSNRFIIYPRKSFKINSFRKNIKSEDQLQIIIHFKT